jgi:hypothetical protein
MGPPPLGLTMRLGRWFGDLSLVRQGVQVAVGFGLHSIEGLIDVAELLEHSVYEPQTLRRTPTGFVFTLMNPPLRMGAFSSVRLFWNGQLVDPGQASIALPHSPVRALGSIGPREPVTLPVGRRFHFIVQADPVPRGRQRLRLELQSVAIPPLVWFEFDDELRESRSAGA